MPDPLSLIPDGSQYNELRWALQILEQDFPQDYSGLSNQASRIEGWIAEIDSGGRDADQIRDDIVKYIIGEEAAIATYGITPEQFQQLILGANEGGIDLGDVRTDSSAGLKQDLFNVAGGAEVWQHEDGTIYLAYQAPGTDDDPVWIAYEVVSDLEAFFGPGQEPVISRNVTAEWWGQQGVIHMGGADDQIMNTSQDPFATWEMDLERRAKVEGPWVYDADYQQLLMEALLEGRQLEVWEIQSTQWYRDHNAVQRQWMITQNTDPEQAAMLLEQQKTGLTEQFRQAGGGQDINTDVIDWLATNLLAGNISQQDVGLQIRALTDPFSGIAIHPDLQGLDSGAEFTNSREDEVRDLLHQWLGPMFGEWSDADIAQIAGDFRNDPNARTDFVEGLKDQRMALLPQYEDRNVSYQAIANTWKQWWMGQWGQAPDETSDLWLQVLRNNDTGVSGELLRREGLNQGVDKVVEAFNAAALSKPRGLVRNPV